MAPLKFLIVGALNTLAGLVVIYTCKGLFGFTDVLSNAVGYGCGIALSFVLNRRWTFEHMGAATPALFRFLAVIAVAYVANLTAVMLAIRAGVNSYAAQALGVPVYAALTYWGSGRFAFVGPDVRRTSKTAL
jgi:putative flippase GtrA